MNTIECTICKENLFDGRVVESTPCGHTFHSECIRRYMRESVQRDE